MIYYHIQTYNSSSGQGEERHGFIDEHCPCSTCFVLRPTQLLEKIQLKRL